MAKALWMLAVVMASVVAEPPVDRQYLPPSSRGGLSTQYGAPARSQGGFGGFGQGSSGSPSSQYGAPARGNFGGNNQYRVSQNGVFGRSSFGATPSSQYGAPSRNGGVPSSQYGAPSRSSSFGGIPSSQYGAPSRSGSFGGVPSSQYGAPSRSGSFGGSPSSQYGAPSRSGSFGGAPSSQYGAPGQQYNAPSQQYGAPSAFASNAPSAQYGAPNQGGRGGGNGYSGDQYDEPANYQFSWEVNDPQSGNDFGHEEARQGDQAEGKYYVLLPDGRKQIVEYTANEEGYKPMIRYEGEANNAAGGYPRGGSFGGRGGAQGPY